MGLAECKGRRDGGKEGRRDGGTEGRTEGRREGGREAELQDEQKHVETETDKTVGREANLGQGCEGPHLMLMTT